LFYFSGMIIQAMELLLVSRVSTIHMQI